MMRKLLVLILGLVGLSVVANTDTDCVVKNGHTIYMNTQLITKDASYLAAAEICSNGGDVSCVLEKGHAIETNVNNKYVANETSIDKISIDASYLAAAKICGKKQMTD